MLKIGLTGGIGSGKSTVARMLSEAGFPVVDADAIAREIMEPGSPVLSDVAKHFGADLVSAEGVLDRAELARRAFANEKETAKLNAITHPAVRKESDRRFAELEASGTEAAIYEVPLLVEEGLDKGMDLTVVVDVDPKERVRRLVEMRGLDAEDARNRIARQIDDAQRRAKADVVLDNNDTLDELQHQVNNLVARIKQML